MGGLRLDTGRLAIQGGDSGPAVVPSKPTESALLHALRGANGHRRMPAEGDALKPDEIALVERWVAAGAPAPVETPAPDPRSHWSFQPIAAPAVPTIPTGGNSIDAFLAADRAKHGLTTNAPADRLTLLRRVSLDLVGLPPTYAEQTAFLADAAPDAYERVVDRLLESPAYGERWGRHWMDVWRYSDWAGYGGEHRESQKHIWRWRDWIVESLNADRGYDRMILEMLAADELSPADSSALRATGFLGRNWYKFNRNVVLDNMVEHTSKAFMGLTLNCAKCHDHMYDPVSQSEAYRFRAFFQSHDVRLDRVAGVLDTQSDGLPRVYDGKPDEPTKVFRRGDEKDLQGDPLKPGVPEFLAKGMPAIRPVALPLAAWYPDLRPEVTTELVAEANRQEDAARTALATADNESNRTALAWRTAERIALEARIAAEKAKYAVPPAGNAAQLAEAAAKAEKASTLSSVHRQFAAERAALTVALANPDSAKVAQAVAAAGPKFAELEKQRAAAQAALAKPGATYTPIGPTYPKVSTGRRSALAKWLIAPENPLVARVAVNHLWLRHFGAPLVPTTFDFGRNGRPPTHPELLDHLATTLRSQGWRMKPLHRLIVTSQSYRLGSAIRSGDPNVAKDPDNHRYWRMNARRLEAEAVRDAALHVAGRLDRALGGPDLDHRTEESTLRRGLYYRHANEKRGLMLATFDAANPNECYRRSHTVAPQQALALANGPLARASARKLAAEMSQWFADDDGFVDKAFAVLLGRTPRLDEKATATAFLKRPSATEPPRAALLHVLMNHHDFVTIR
jgi:hypothetical protein